MPVDQKSLDKALDAIRKVYGDDTVRTGDEDQEVVRVPSGIIQLDKLIGGGFPLGRWVHAYGGYGSGKTLINMHMIREAQKMGLSCAYYNMEKQYSKKWAQSIGVDTGALQVIEGSIIEEVGAKLEVLLPVINIHIIDSVGIGVSIDQLAAKLDEWRPGIAARAWGKVITRANARFNKDTNMIVLINQTREVFGKAGQERPTGGNQLEYASSLSLHFTKSSWLYRDSVGNLSENGKKTDEETGRTKPDGIDLVVSVKKSRVSDPYGSARMRLEFGTGGHFDEAWALSRSAIFGGIIKQSGSWYTLPDGERVQGESKVRDYINGNPEFAEKLRAVFYDEE